jgi:CheY-like chemotaxis protein
VSRSIRSTPALRVLLVTQSDEETRGFGLSLHQDGIAVTRVRDVAAATTALQGQGFDAVLLSHPLPDADVIASCAAVRQVPGAPPIVLLDSLDPNAQTFPTSIRPVRLLRKPVDVAKLGALLHEVAESVSPEPAAPPVAPEAPFALAATLLRIAAAGETGVLEVSGGGLCTRIVFESGAAVSAEGGSLRETLGRLLLRRGALAEADYVRVIERMTERVMANEQQRMGEVLVELGLLSRDEVRAALETQLFEKVTACFRLPDASWSFSELDALPEGLEPFRLPPVERLVHAGLAHLAPESIVAWLSPQAALRPRLTRPPEDVGALLALDADALRWLSRLDGSCTLAEAVRASETAPALLATLLAIEALDLGTRARAVARGPFAREVVGRPKRADAPAPAPTPAADKRLEAEQCFRRGQQLVAAGRALEALRLLRRAVELEPGEPEYATVEAWTSYLEARQAVRVARARAVAASVRLLEADPKAPRVHTILGRLALDEGDLPRAAREFEQALLRDPADEEAARGLRQARR